MIFPELPGTFGGMRVMIIDAQKQARTPRDVRGPWIRPKVPNKRQGRKGTRRMFKRSNPPQWSWLYREPEDVVVIHGHTMVATPRQADAIRRETTSRI